MATKSDITKNSTMLDGLYLLALIAIWFVIVGYVVHASFPSNALHLPFETRIHAKYWLPQHWAFFTQDPRDIESLRYFCKNGNADWRLVATQPRATASNGFGFYRRNLALGMEAANILSQIPGSAYRVCQDAPETCLDSIPIAAQLKNDYPDPTLCGDIAFVSAKPIPWAWVSNGVISQMKSTIARAVITCQ